MRSLTSRRLAVALLAAFVLVACSSATTPTLPPVVVTVYQAGTATPVGVTRAPAVATLDSSQPAATAIPQYGPDAYPENVNPLTGEAADPAKLNRIPIAVKISNFPYSVRPQFGLSLADLVFEHLAEAGLT